MSRDDILASARDAFVSFLLSLFETLPDTACKRLFDEAGTTKTFDQYQLLMQVHNEIRTNKSAISEKLKSELEALVQRSLETAYNNSRLSIREIAASSALQLLDTAVLEDDVKLRKTVSLFYEGISLEIRPLNVRMANLYGQSEALERENPFRPYLIAKTLATASGVDGIDRLYVADVTEQLAATAAPELATIYQRINQLLEEYQVPATLPRVATMLSPPKPAQVFPAGVSTSSTSYSASSPPNAYGAETTRPAQTMQIMGPATTSAPHSATSASAGPTRPVSHVQRLQQLVVRWQEQLSKGGGTPADGASNQPIDVASGMHSGSSDFAASGAHGAHGHSAPANDYGLESATNAAGLRKFLAHAATSASNANQLATAAIVGVAGADTAAAGMGAQSSLFQYVNQHSRAAGEVRPVPLSGNIPNVIFEHRTDLEKQSSTLAELITIDVVGMLFEYILRDINVPAEVRAQLGRLQFYLLKVALADQTVLVDKAHPAGRLINRIGTASLSLADNEALATGMNDEVHAIVESLLETDLYSRSVLEVQLERFEEFVRQSVKASDAGLKLTIETLDEAERRSLHLDRIMREIAQGLDGLAVPDYVRAFLIDHWSQVIETSDRQSRGAIRHRAIVPLVAWSVLPKTDERSRRQLLSGLGSLLHRLREGLVLIDLPAESSDLFFRKLLKVHRTLIKSADSDAGTVRLPEITDRFSGFITPGTEVEIDWPEIDIEIHPAVFQQLAKAAKAEIDHADQTMLDEPEAADSTATGKEQDVPDYLLELVTERLYTGVKVEINLDGEVRTGILAWRGKKVSNLFFSFSTSHRPTTISLRLFRALLANGRAKFLEAFPLFERAVESVLTVTDASTSRHRTTDMAMQ